MPKPFQVQPDLAWSLLLIRRTVSKYKHLPRLTAAEYVMAELPTHEPRFALSLSDTLDQVLPHLEV